MANSSSEPIGSVQVWHDYGRVTLEFLAPGRIMASQEQIDHLMLQAQRRMQNSVVPEVERLVEEDGGRIGKESHAEADDDVQLPSATVAAHADCEVMADVSDETLAEVKRVLQHELLRPLDRLFRNRTRRHEEARFALAVRSIMGGLKRRGS